MDADDSFIAQDSAGTPLNDDTANSLLNFTTTADELELQSAKRQKTSRDPMSHRIIEKRRRDRMNNCLADLSRLIPTSYLKQGQGRIEKTEIIEMAIKHIKTLQAQVDGSQCQNYETTKTSHDGGSSMENSKLGEGACCRERFFQGFRECQDETLRYFVEGEGMVASDPFCVRVMEHLTAVSPLFVQPYAQADEKPEAQTDLEVQQMAGSSSFRSSSPMNGLSSQDSILPLPPITGGLMVPASPIRDKHLRNLLTRHALQQLEAEREAAAPQNKAASCSASETSLISLPLATPASVLLTSPLPGGTANSVSVDSALSCGLKNSDGSVNEGVSSGYVSDMSAMDHLSNGTGPGDMMLSTKDSSVVNIYKFKHNITKRFSQEGKVISQRYDGGSSSTSSREADEDRHHHGTVKYRSMKNKCRHASSSDSGPYPTSELSGATSTSSHDSAEGSHDRNKCRKLSSRSQGSGDRGVKMECCPRSSVPLPGFMLHPSGTHYLPMSVCHNVIPDMFDTGLEAGVGPPVFHPISIPVHFRGPVISVPGSSVSTVSASCRPEKNIDSVSYKDSKVGKKGLQ